MKYGVRVVLLLSSGIVSVSLVDWFGYGDQFPFHIWAAAFLVQWSTRPPSKELFVTALRLVANTDTPTLFLLQFTATICSTSKEVVPLGCGRWRTTVREYYRLQWWNQMNDFVFMAQVIYVDPQPR